MNASDNRPSKKTRRTLSFLGKHLDHTPPLRQHDQKSSRVSGPYFDANVNAYRLVVFDGSRRKSVRAETEQEALRLKAELEGALGQSDRTIGDTLDEFIEHIRKKGAKDSTISNLQNKLSRFLPRERTIAGFTPEDAQKLYDEETVKQSRFGRPMQAMTHQYVLKASRRFFRWSVERGYARMNPFEKVRPIGKPHVGKDQLRIDEARRLTDLLVVHSEQNKPGAIATLTQLMLGLRTGEVLDRQVRDVDDGGKVFWVPSGKTDNARRRLDVPERLQPILLTLVEGQAPNRLLFPGHRGQRRSNPWQWKNVARYCRLAGLRRVCPHSLRGLHSSLAVSSGCTSAAVASALGHGSFSVTAKHYVDADTLRNTKVQRVADALTSGRDDDMDQFIERLRTLPPQSLDRLRRALDGKK